MKLSDLKDGDTVYVDNGFTCMDAGPKTVFLDDGDLCVSCDQGEHNLVGQEDCEGELVGVSFEPFPDCEGRQEL